MLTYNILHRAIIVFFLEEHGNIEGGVSSSDEKLIFRNNKDNENGSAQHFYKGQMGSTRRNSFPTRN